MAASKAASPTPASPTGKGPASPTKATAAFFQHPLDPHPPSNPPFYVRLFDEHLAGLVSNEGQLVFTDFMKFSHELASKPATEDASPFGANDSIQQLLDQPLSSFAGATEQRSTSNDGWERRRVAIRNFTASFFQRAVSVVASNLHQADCDQTAGFRFRGAVGGGQSYTSEADGLYIHIWRTSSQARWLMDCLKGIQQVIFEYHVRTIRAPVFSIFLYRGLLYTVAAAVPVIADPVPSLLPDSGESQVDSGFGVALDAPVLCAGLGQHFCGEAHERGGMPPESSLDLKRARDGRAYMTSLGWRTTNVAFGLTDLPANTDSNVWLRREAVSRMDATTRANIRSAFATGKSGPGSAANLSRRFVSETLVEAAASEITAAVEKVEGNAQLLYKDNTVSTIMHRCGVPLRQLYLVYAKAYADVPGSEKRSSSKYKWIREALEMEMALRTVKQMLRLELRSSPGEEAGMHVNRVNRLYSSLTKKATNVWTDQLLPLLRRKYDAPPDFSINLTAGMLKIMAAYGSARLGVAYDKQSSRFVTFTAIHQSTTVFNTPPALEFCAAPVGEADASLSKSQGVDDSSSEFSLAKSVSMRMPQRAPQQAMMLEPAKVAEAAGNIRVALDELLQAAVDSPSMAKFFQASTGNELLAASAGARVSSFTQSHVTTFARVVRQLITLRLLGHPEGEDVRLAMLNAMKNIISIERDEVKKETGSTERAAGLVSPSVLMLLRLHTMADTLRMSDADAIEETVAAVVHALGPRIADDAMALGRARVLASKVNGYAPGIVSGAKLFRHATWVDVGLCNEYFTVLVNSVAGLNVNSDTATMAEVFRLTSRVTRRQDVQARRQMMIQAYRKATSALVASQTAASCRGLRDQVADALKHHQERFGPADVQTSVVFGQAVYIFVTCHQDKLDDIQLADVRKFHYLVSTMGTSTIEALKSTLVSEQYTGTLAKLIAILDAQGDTILAEKALNQAAGAIGDLDARGASMASTVRSLQGGAAGRLQKMVRMAANIGPEYLFRRINREDAAYRQGLEIVEHAERFQLLADELFSRWSVPRVRMLRFEDREWNRVLFFGERHIYEVPPDLPEEVANAINADADAASSAILEQESSERQGLRRQLIKFEETMRRDLGMLGDLVDAEVRARRVTEQQEEHTVAELSFARREDVNRCLLQMHAEVTVAELSRRADVSRSEVEDRLNTQVAHHIEFLTVRLGECRTGEERERNTLVTDESNSAAWLQLRAHEVTSRLAITAETRESADRIAAEFHSDSTRLSDHLSVRDALLHEEAAARNGALVVPEDRERNQLLLAAEESHTRVNVEGTLHADLASCLCEAEYSIKLFVTEESEASERNTVFDDERQERDALVSSCAGENEHVSTFVTAKAQLFETESEERETLERDSLSAMWKWLWSTHNDAVASLDTLAAERVELENTELSARGELEHSSLLYLLERCEAGKRELVGCEQAAAFRSIRAARDDSATLRSINSKAAARQKFADDQIAQRNACENEELSVRRTMIQEWMDVTKEGVTNWLVFIAAAQKFEKNEAKGRSDVATTEAASFSRIMSTFRADYRMIYLREEARLRAAERQHVGPVRQLHEAIKYQKVLEVKQEEAAIEELAKVVREAQALRQKQLHDRVASVRSKVKEVREQRRQEAVADKAAQRELIEEHLSGKRASDSDRVAELRRQHRKQREAHVDALKNVRLQRAESVSAHREEVEVSLAAARQQTAERMQLVTTDQKRQKATETRLIAGRPHFSVAQSRADALKEKDELLKRVRKEKQILAAIRMLDQQDEETVAASRRRDQQAKLLVSECCRDAFAEKRTADVQHQVSEVRTQRALSQFERDQALEERRNEFRARREEHAAAIAELRAAQATENERRVEELQSAKQEAKARMDELLKREASDVARRRDDAAVVDQQRVACRLALMRHANEEDGHLVKSPVKAPATIRHLPPIRHDHTRVLHQQALHMQTIVHSPTKGDHSAPVKAAEADVDIQAPSGVDGM